MARWTDKDLEKISAGLPSNQQIPSFGYQKAKKKKSINMQSFLPSILLLNPQLNNIHNGDLDGDQKSKGESKYRNKWIVYDNITFDSNKEKKRYIHLKRLEKAGQINNLKHHSVYLLVEDKDLDFKLCYEPDFVYTDKQGNTVVEDCKAWDKKTGSFILTQEFKRKKRLMKKKYGIDVVIV